MRAQRVPVLPWALLVACALGAALATTASLPPSSAKHAFMTFLVDPTELPGVLVLGKSIDNTGTERRKVVVLSSDVPGEASGVLEKAGWVVMHGADLEGFHPNRALVAAFGATVFERIVVVSANSILAANLDELFACQGFCAIGEALFSPDLLVVSPSQRAHRALLAHHAYPDHSINCIAFLRKALPLFQASPMFDPALAGEAFQLPAMNSHRLPNRFAGDLLMYYLRESSWWEGTPKTFQYMAHPLFLPWNWYGYGVLSMHWVWFDLFRTIVPPCSPFLSAVFVLLPVLVLVLGMRFRALVVVPFELAATFFLEVLPDHSLQTVVNAMSAVWVVLLLVLAPVATPSLSVGVHPYVSWAVAAEWVLAGLGLLLMCQMHVIHKLQDLHPIVSEVPAHPWEGRAMLMLLVVTVAGMAIDLPFRKSGIVLFVRLGVCLVILCSLLGLTLYRLPVILSKAPSLERVATRSARAAS